MSELKNISFEKDTKRVNDYIKQKIADHLWMFCGYNDSIYPAVNMDAKYIKAIFDLYNVIIDSSLFTWLCRQKSKYLKKGKPLKDIYSIRDIISTLRTVGGHTVSEENNRQEIILQFRKWQLDNCGTDDPTKVEDFENLIKGLLDLKKKYFDLLNHFLQYASSLKDSLKNKMIEDWEEAIIEHYFKTANKNMFENKLIEWYKIKQQNGTYETNIITINNAISNWIMNEIYLKEQKDIEQWMKAKETVKLTQKQIDSLNQSIEKAKLSIEKKKKEVANFVGKANILEDLKPIDYKNHFLSKEILGKKLRNAIPVIKSKKLTLLPQDLFGYIIKTEFIV